MEVLLGLVGLVIPFIVMGVLWKGAKEDWERSK